MLGRDLGPDAPEFHPELPQSRLLVVVDGDDEIEAEVLAHIEDRRILSSRQQDRGQRPDTLPDQCVC